MYDGIMQDCSALIASLVLEFFCVAETIYIFVVILFATLFLVLSFDLLVLRVKQVVLI